MTREEWIDEITDFDDLKRFGYENGVYEDELNSIIDDDQLDEYVEEDISNGYRSWRSLRDALGDIPTGYDWYRCDGGFDYTGLDRSDFLEMKDEILDYLDSTGFFDEDEEEDDGHGPSLYIDFFDLDPDEDPEPEPEVQALDMGLISSLCGFNEAAVASNRASAPAPAPAQPAQTPMLGDIGELLAF